MIQLATPTCWLCGTLSIPTNTVIHSMESRLDDLEIRLAHQELAIEQLTQASLQQQRTIEQLQGEVEYLKSLLRELSPSAVASVGEETPPPHY